MIVVLVVGLLALLLFWQTAGRIEETNDQIAEALGDAYDPAKAGRPGCDALGLTLVVVLLTVGAVMVAVALFPVVP